MSDADSELDRIAGALDANGDEVTQEHPIENPGDNGGESAETIAEPHPDEPGVSDPGADPASAPDDD